MTKICKQCGLEKNMEDFEKAKTCKDGRMATCKKCRLENKKKYTNIFKDITPIIEKLKKGELEIEYKEDVNHYTVEEPN